MIIYHPFKDANHCLYRLISLLYKNVNNIDEEQIHFMDFYYLFPSELKNISNWPRGGAKLYIKVNNISESYEIIANPRRIFFELKELRKNTLAHLLSKKVIFISDNKLKLDETKIPDSLIKKIETDSFRKTVEYQIIAEEVPKIKIKGKNGLKAKSNLMEYRYDF